ncbi:MAG: response regulator [Calditrichaeota bacterium]|jgi:two-component system alkaline phosphatase synthesis response regulator PhoP|nr:response regulator [Calditrichota bacterium]MBT7618726.1 response regulator [Calditrichota bacterium]MBT7787885.1 response regulator [Calditrichota bacterium]
MTEKKTILIIDDEPDTFTYFSTLLEDNGYNTVGAENGDEGLARVKESPPDLITMDITMPKMSGVKAYRTLKEGEQTKSIPIIIITGVSEDFKEFISSRKQIPAPDGYLAKPIDENEFINLVKKLTSS